MGSWERFDETPFPDKEVFYSSPNVEYIIDAHHRHAKRVFKEFNNLDEYHDLYVMN